MYSSLFYLNNCELLLIFFSENLTKNGMIPIKVKDKIIGVDIILCNEFNVDNCNPAFTNIPILNKVPI